MSLEAIVFDFLPLSSFLGFGVDGLVVGLYSRKCGVVRNTATGQDPLPPALSMRGLLLF